MSRSLVLAAVLTLAACAVEPAPAPIEPVEPAAVAEAPMDLEDHREVGRIEARQALATGLVWFKEFGYPSAMVWLDDDTGLPVESLGCEVIEGEQAYTHGWNEVIRDAARDGGLAAHSVADRIRDDATWAELFDEDPGVPLTEFVRAWRPPDGVQFVWEESGRWCLQTRCERAYIGAPVEQTVRVLDDGRTIAVREQRASDGWTIRAFDVERGLCIGWVDDDS